MSGGVDSSVAAALLQLQGYEVIGLSTQTFDNNKTEKERFDSCCSIDDMADARRVCDTLGIPHYVLDYESRFRAEVMDSFADAYLRGETPVPCIACNRTVKFRDLLRTARELGAEVLATGHYVRRVGEETATEGRTASSARNRFRGLVTSIIKDTVMAQVEIQSGPHRLVSLMSREAVDELDLQVGSVAIAVIKSTTVVVEKPAPPSGAQMIGNS